MAADSETIILLAGGLPQEAPPILGGADRLLIDGQAAAALFANPAAALEAALALRSDAAIALHGCPCDQAGEGGPGMQRAQAIQAAARPGQALLSAAAAAAVRPFLPAAASLHDWGVRRLTDLIRPEHLFELLAAGDSAAPPRTLDTYQTNLPVQPSALIGRESQIATVTTLLRQPDLRLLTLTGPGGIGKTRLAAHAAARLLDAFPDGVWFVDLAPLSAPAQVLPLIAQTCGIKDSAPAELADRLAEALRDQVLLLVLDNAEHLLEAARDLALLLARLPSLQLLVTSRERLRLSVEHELVVPPLGLADQADSPGAAPASEAVRLFLARAQSGPVGGAQPDGQLASIAAICQRLDGLPLAIELAAARSKIFPPAALLARLHNSLPLLTGGGRDLPARQQTLRGAIAWSYALLTPAEQALLRRLAVFAGGWEIAALEAVCADPPDAAGSAGLDIGDCLDGLNSLIDKSLVHVAPADGPSSAAEPRFRLLQTIRDFALEQLDQDELAPLQRRHAAYFAGLAEQSAAGLRGGRQQHWLSRIEDEHDNLRAALRWAIEEDADLAARMAGALWRFWWMHGHWTEGRQWIGAALAQRAALADEQLALLLQGDGVLAQSQGAIQHAAAALEESLMLLQRTSNQVGLALTLNALGNNLRMQGDFLASRGYFQDSLLVWRALGDQAGVALALNNLGLIHCTCNDYTAALAYYNETIQLQRRLGTRSLLALSLNNLANLFAERGQYEQARLTYEECLAIHRALGDRGSLAIGLLGQANLARLGGDYAEAEALLEQSAAMARGLGDFLHLMIWTASHGEIAFERGDCATARRYFEETLALARRENDRHQQATLGLWLALVAITDGQPERCAARIEQTLPFLSPSGNQLNLVLLAEAAARLALARGQAEQAATIWSAAVALIGRLGTARAVAEQARDAELLAAIQAAIAPDRFAAAWTAGQTLSILAAVGWRPPEDAAPGSLAGDLSEREREVLRLVVEGLTNAEIAERLVVSLFTVKAHMRSILRKLGVRTRTAAARLAYEQGLT